jgi:hypothetical protein
MILGLTGRAGSGKDTVYHRLNALVRPTVVERRSFADPLKRSVAALFNISVWQLEEMKNDNVSFVECYGQAIGEKREFSIRSFLQRYGTEAHRDVFGEDFWLDATLPLGTTAPEDTLVVITDCRFANEAKRVKDCGGVVFEVVGPEGPMDPNAEHGSERALPNDLRDGYIHNEIRYGGFEALHASLATDLLSHPALEGVNIYDAPQPAPVYRCYRHYYSGHTPCAACAAQ